MRASWRHDDDTIPVASFPEDRDDAEALVRGSIAEYGCPFAWLLEWDFDEIYDDD